MEGRENEVARICDVKQYRGAMQKQSSRDLLGVFMSLWLEIAQGKSIGLNKEETLGCCKLNTRPEFTEAWKTFMFAPARLERKESNIRKGRGDTTEHPKFLKYI